MKLEVGKVYHLEGWIFNQEILEKNKDGFEFVGTTKESMHDDEYCKFVGKNTGQEQFCFKSAIGDYASVMPTPEKTSKQYTVFGVKLEELVEHPRFEEFKVAAMRKHSEIKIHNLFDLEDRFDIFMYDRREKHFDATTSKFAATEDIKILDVDTFLESVSFVFIPKYKKRSDHKRVKGTPRKKRTVNKATLHFTSGDKYTLKGFESVLYDAGTGNIKFIIKATYKGTVLHEEAVTLPVFDISRVEIRGVKESFDLDFLTTNATSYVNLEADGAFITTNYLDMFV